MSWGQRFVGKVNDPLRVRFFIRRPLGKPTGGGSGEVVFPGDSVILLGSLECPMPGRLPKALPD